MFYGFFPGKVRSKSPWNSRASFQAALIMSLISLWQPLKFLKFRNTVVCDFNLDAPPFGNNFTDCSPFVRTKQTEIPHLICTVRYTEGKNYDFVVHCFQVCPIRKTCHKHVSFKNNNENGRRALRYVFFFFQILMVWDLEAWTQWLWLYERLWVKGERGGVLLCLGWSTITLSRYIWMKEERKNRELDSWTILPPNKNS